MKILYVISGLSKAGAEKQLYSLVTNLPKDYTIAVLSLSGGEFEEEFKKAGVKIKVIGVKSITQLFEVLSTIRSYAKEMKPDLIHSFLPHANILTKLAIRNKFPTITSVRVNEKKKYILNILERVTDPLARAITTNSQTTKEALAKNWAYNKKKIYAIPNGYEIKEKITRIREENTVLTVAHFRKQKDYETNIKVAKHLEEKGIKFLYVGKDQERRYAKKIKEKIKLSKAKNIQVLGLRKDVPELLASASVFFLPTLYEGQSNAIIEAMMQECPIVTTDIDENKEIVESNQQALLVKTKDVQAMARAITKLLDNKQLAKKLAESARKRTKEMTIERLVENHIEVYQNVCD